VRGERQSTSWIDIANRAVVAFEEYVERSAGATVSLKWASTGQPGSGQLIVCVGNREVIYLGREDIANRFAELDRRNQHEKDVRVLAEAKRSEERDRRLEGDS
jgi:hypothetical protein